jgi:hypothetical protein
VPHFNRATLKECPRDRLRLLGANLEGRPIFFPEMQATAIDWTPRPNAVTKRGDDIGAFRITPC